MPTDLEIWQAWKEHPYRPVFLIDETREDLEPGEQFVAFTLVASNACEILAGVQRLVAERQMLAGQTQNVVFKGSRLFGSRKKVSHEPIRQATLETIKRAQAVSIMMTTSTSISDAFKTTSGKIEAIRESGERRSLTGRELMPVLTFIKRVATELKFGAQQIDVVLDRSSALGLDPEQVGIAETQFQVLGPSPLEEAPGRETSAVCPSSFMIISTSDGGPFSDLLLLPDTIGYLGFQRRRFEEAKATVRAGTAFWTWYPEMAELNRAAL